MPLVIRGPEEAALPDIDLSTLIEKLEKSASSFAQALKRCAGRT
jgi:hypothetical protein